MKTYGIVSTTMDENGAHRWHLAGGKTVNSETRVLAGPTITPSSMEADFAHWVSNMSYAA